MAAEAGIPTSMRAFAFTPSGGMTLDAEASVPTPGANQVLVKVHSAGLNPVRGIQSARVARQPQQAHAVAQVDYKTVAMPTPVLWLTGMTNLLGRDFSGVVVRSSAPGFAVGDRVFGHTVTASLAEYALADSSAIAKLPAAVSHADAAALPVAGLTSLQAFAEHGRLQAGQKVLIVGASGGTGTLGVQIAKCLGAGLVAGVCSGANAELVRSLGADVIANYTMGDDAVERALRASGPFDMTYDCVTSPEDPSYEPLSRKLLKPGGMHVAINGVDGDWMRLIISTRCGINMHRKDFRLFTARGDGAQLAQLASWVADGRLKPPLDTRVPFEEAAVLEAYAKLKSRRVKGKLVCDIVA